MRNRFPFGKATIILLIICTASVVVAMSASGTSELGAGCSIPERFRLKGASQPSRVKNFLDGVGTVDSTLTSCSTVYEDPKKSTWLHKAFFVAAVPCDRTREYNGTIVLTFPSRTKYPDKLKDPRVTRAIFTSRFGNRVHPVFGDRRFHDGADIAARMGEEALAIASGKVLAAGESGNGCGTRVRIEVLAGITAVYCHLSAIPAGITEGALVARGQVVGYIGQSGTATGPHLHLQLEQNGVPFDPMNTKKVVWDFAITKGGPDSALDRALKELN
jgi:murein DD-endopeptidase MepM/ murein hydrolase activator NlpD